MNIEKGLISSSQLGFLIIGLMQGSTYTAAFISGITKQNTWVVVLLSSLLTFPLLLIYISLCEKYPHKNLIEINELIYGPHIGKLVSIIYLYSLWFIIPANMRYVGDFFTNYLFPETPLEAFIILFTCICAWAVRGGIEVIARSTLIIVILTFTEAIIITLFLFKYMRISNFMPFLNIGLMEFIQAMHGMMAIPFGETFVFLMIIPYINNIKQAKSSILSGFAFGSLFLLGVLVRNTAVLGIFASIHVLPSYQTAKIINIGEIITRMEVLVAVFVLFNLFVKVCLFYYATVLGTAQLFKLKSYKCLVIPIGIISAIMSVSMYDSSVEEAYNAANIYPVFVTPVIFLLPIITLLLTNFRKLAKK